MSGNVHRLPNRDSALKALYDDLSAKHMFPFWATSTDVEHDEVKQLLATAKAIPYLWRCAEDIEPVLDRAVELITMDDSERRSVILVNPGLAPRRATVSTMYTAYRLNDANEIMPPHKHSPSAIRFGLKGKGNFTGVDGENIVFGPGDMVLTPNDTWHNHGTVGNEQALNLSVLDLPLVETLNAIHFDHDYKEEVTASSSPRKSRLRDLPAITRRPLMDTADCCRVSPGQNLAARAIRRRCSSIAGRWCANYSASIKTARATRMRGCWSNTSTRPPGNPFSRPSLSLRRCCNRDKRRCRCARQPTFWRRRSRAKAIRWSTASVTIGTSYDTLAIPGGSWYEHHNTSAKEPLFLFVASDEPTLKKLDLYKKWGKDAAGAAGRIE